MRFFRASPVAGYLGTLGYRSPIEFESTRPSRHTVNTEHRSGVVHPRALELTVRFCPPLLAREGAARSRARARRAITNAVSRSLAKSPQFAGIFARRREKFALCAAGEVRS